MLTAIPQPVFREDGIWFVPTVTDNLDGANYNTYVLCREDVEEETEADEADEGADWYCFEYGEMYDPLIYSAFKYWTCTLDEAISRCNRFISEFSNLPSKVPTQA